MVLNDSAEVAWAKLRATRWSPPTPAKHSAERRETYTFALEQAEQMFRAAATVGPATKPLLLFYGLSQAGRAVAAASSELKRPDEWRLVGHGISQIDLTQPLPQIGVYAGIRGSFVRLSAILDSPLWTKAEAIPLAALWDLIPENRLHPIDSDHRSRRTPLLLLEHHYNESHPLASADVVYFPPWLLKSDHPGEEFVNYMADYPDTHFHSFVRTGDGPAAAPDFTSHLDGWGELIINFEMPDGRPAGPEQRQAHLMATTRRYNDSLWLFPALKPAIRSMHPLMSWWAVLHTLSILARYQPAEWARELAVDLSSHAVPSNGYCRLQSKYYPC
ncbi:YaaC family protein [Micromonospora sp. NPDC049049]|uniref:YaaC family protein n=1 Tax=Micromonospora sp. NPDC049049 TaxID=3155495 RepID=UPI0033E8AB1D